MKFTALVEATFKPDGLRLMREEDSPASSYFS